MICCVQKGNPLRNLRNKCISGWFLLYWTYWCKFMTLVGTVWRPGNETARENHMCKVCEKNSINKVLTSLYPEVVCRLLPFPDGWDPVNRVLILASYPFFANFCGSWFARLRGYPYVMSLLSFNFMTPPPPCHPSKNHTRSMFFLPPTPLGWLCLWIPLTGAILPWFSADDALYWIMQVNLLFSLWVVLNQMC